jgi:peptidyl-prolyl cis-trans isomerase SurA
MMKLSWFARAMIVLITPLLSMMAAAQSGPAQGPGESGLNIPQNVQFVGRQEPGVRKATAIVNGDVITGSDVDQRLALVITSNQIELPASEIENFRAQVLRNLIDEALQIQAAVQQELTIEPREVDAYYERVAQSFHQTPTQFSAYLRTIGSSDRSMKRQIRAEMAWQRLQRRQIEPFVSVSDEEVQAAIDRMNADRGTAEYHVAEIWMSATPETQAQVLANMTRMAQQLHSGASFPAYARQYSEASSAARGGDLGWLRVGQMPDELAAVVVQMPPGAISEPIANSGGYSIIALADSRRILVADPRDAVLSLMQVSLSMPANTPQAQIEARGEALAQAAQTMGGCGGAAAAAQRLGAELVSNDQVQMRNLPPPLQQMLMSLSVGQATPAFGSAERISVLVMCGRDDPQAVAGPDRVVIERDIETERVNRRAQRYLRDLRRDAVIDYR